MPCKSTQTLGRFRHENFERQDQRKRRLILEQLAGAANWLGVAAEDRTALGQGGGSRRADFHTEHCFVCLLRPRHRVSESWNFSKALEHGKEHLTNG